jgi:diguanylate cyclase (GGDEF)-like protein/PAS domain S-box-containing protein
LFRFGHCADEGCSPVPHIVFDRQIVKLSGRPPAIHPFMYAYLWIMGTDDGKQAAGRLPVYAGHGKEKMPADPIFHSGEYCDSIIQNHSDIIFTTDANGFIKAVNPAFTKVFGLKVQDAQGISWLEFIEPDKKPLFQHAFDKVLKGKAGQIEIEALSEKGANIFHIHMMPLMDGAQCREILFFGRNMTELKKMEEKLEKLVYYDGNTGLPNERKLEQILNKRMKRAKREKRSFPVLFIQMDRIKTVNDAFGHRAGDEARIQLAERIRSVLPRGSFLGRFSTDKFTVLPGGKSDPDSVMALCQKIVEATQEPLLFENQEFYIASSIGISVYPFDGQDYASLMKNADAALSRTEAGTNKNIVFYVNEMDEEMIERVELERSLRKAIEQDEFFLAYQPIINPVTKEIVACEALLRWEHPKWGNIPPMKFIPIAEETGMIHTLGKWVLKTACSQVREWQKQGFENISASINVSAYQLQNNRFIDNIKQALEHSGLEPRYLHLELTESVMIDKSLKTVDMLRELMEMGVNISIDDFGTGYSSLSYLKHFPVHSLKIDRSFIQNLNRHSPDLAIVHAILTMGHGLGLRIVAEGIETKEQLRMLTNLGCDLVQGYLIERPLEARRFTHWLKRRQQNSMHKIDEQPEKD